MPVTVREAGVQERVRLAEPVPAQEKARLLVGAELVALGSHSEICGMSVAEALSHGTPCVVSKTALREGSDREGFGYWLDDSDEALAAGCGG